MNRKQISTVMLAKSFASNTDVEWSDDINVSHPISRIEVELLSVEDNEVAREDDTNFNLFLYSTIQPGKMGVCNVLSRHPITSVFQFRAPRMLQGSFQFHLQDDIHRLHETNEPMSVVVKITCYE